MSGAHNSANLFDPVLPCVQPVIEQNSLQVSMESNRESLERRLQLRRTLPELVSQGIYPKLNTPLAFAEQCRHLEQAKTRDQLHKKLKHRPDRKCLVQHHILEDTNPMVDRSLQDKQRLLKKSKLQDNLNDLISHRPGPLDLLSKNILMLDDDSSSLSLSDDVGHSTDNEECFFAYAEQCFQLEQAKTTDRLEKKLKQRADQQCLLQDRFLEDTGATIDRPLEDKPDLLKLAELKNNINFFHGVPIPLNFLVDSSSLPMSGDIVGHSNDNEEGLFADSVGNFSSFFPTSFDSSCLDSGSFDSVSFMSQSDGLSKYSSTSSFEETQLQTFSSISSSQDCYRHQIAESDLTTVCRTTAAVTSPKTLGTSSKTLGFQQLQQLTSTSYIPPAPDITALLVATGKQQQNANVVSSISFNFPVVTQASVASTATEYRQQKTQKKMRTKSVTKPKQIKFHEYKGPPSVMKANQQAAALKNKLTQPHYEILKLQQEQLIKWQIAPKSNSAKPVTIRNASPKLQSLTEMDCSDLNNAAVFSKQVKMLDMINSSPSNPGKSQQIVRIPSISCPTIIPKLSSSSADSQSIPNKSHLQLASMRVTELRDECRKLNLSCSGSKHQLLERLQLHRISSGNVITSLFVEPKPGCGVSSPVTSAQVLPMDIEASSNNIPTSSSMTAMIFNSLATNNKPNISSHGLLSTVSSDNLGYEHGSVAETKPFSQQQVVKVENDKQFTSYEERIAELERNLKQSKEENIKAKNEMKLKDELVEYILSLVKSSNVVSQSTKNNQGVDHLQGNIMEQALKILANQNQNSTVQMSHANLSFLNQQISPNPQAFLKQLLDQQNTTHRPNSQQNHFLCTIPSNNAHLQQQQQNAQQQLFYLNQNSSVSSTNAFNINGKSQQLAPTKMENSNFALYGQVQPPHRRNVFQHEVVGTSTPVLRSSSSFVTLNDGFNPTTLLTYENSDPLSNPAKNVNQRLSQNLNGNSFESMLKLWNLQNQNKIQQRHSDQPTIEDVLDVLSNKSDFQTSTLESHMPATSQQHNSMDIFNIIDINDQSMNNPVAYDMSFPFMMDSTDEAGPRQQYPDSSNQSVDASTENQISRESTMQTPQPELELMDIFTGDDTTSCDSSSFQTLVEQQRPNRPLPAYTNNINRSRCNNSNNRQQTLAKNCIGQWEDLDLSASQLLQTSNNNSLFNKIFTTDPISKS